MTRVHVVCRCAIAGTLTLVAACSNQTPATDADVLRVAVRQPPASLDPRIGSDEDSERVHQLVYSQLFTLGPDFGVAPGLAVRLDHPTPLTYVAFLRSGVRFHDGHELTARDVVYTFTRLLDSDVASSRTEGLRVLRSVAALTDYQIEFTLEEPLFSFPEQLVVPVVPDGSGDDLETFPVGTGPYRFVRRTRDRIDLTTYEGYWDGLPQNAGVSLLVVPDDRRRERELRSGRAELVIDDVGLETAERLEADGFTVVRSSGEAAVLAFEMRDPALRDARVRRAIGHGINREELAALRRTCPGPQTGLVETPPSRTVTPEIRRATYDPGMAKRLLGEAGYIDPDGSGASTRLRLVLQTPADQCSWMQGTIIQQDLRAVGIEVALRGSPLVAASASVLESNAQMYVARWLSPMGLDTFRRTFHSAQIPPLGLNWIHYAVPRVDRLLDEAANAANDEDRLQHFTEARAIVEEDAPYIDLWRTTHLAVTSPHVRGLRLSRSADFLALKDVRKRAPLGRPRSSLGKEPS